MWDNALVFERFRELEVEACQDCGRFEICRGGCPAMAYHTYRDISMPDPECLVNLKLDLKAGAKSLREYV